MDTSTRPMANDERNKESGRFTQGYPDTDFLRAIDELDLPTTTEIAESVGCDRRTAHLRLTESLQDQELVDVKKEVGGAYVWELTETGEQRLEDAD